MGMPRRLKLSRRESVCCDWMNVGCVVYEQWRTVGWRCGRLGRNGAWSMVIDGRDTTCFMSNTKDTSLIAVCNAAFGSSEQDMRAISSST